MYRLKKCRTMVPTKHHSIRLAGLLGLAVASTLVVSGSAFAQNVHHHGSGYIIPDLQSDEFKVPNTGKNLKGFGRLFPVGEGNQVVLRPHPSPVESLRALGNKMIEPKEWAKRPARFSKMPAGYTFLGQFIDHDITLDTISRLDKPIKTSDLENARTVDLDLDCVYGGGPERTPFLYNMPYLKIGSQIKGVTSSVNRYDLLRTSGDNNPVAIIGDPRNDENFVVSQLQAAFISYHNRIADKLVEIEYGGRRAEFCGSANACPKVRDLAARLPNPLKGEVFEKARDHVIHYYHRVIKEDFVPRLIGADRADDIWKNGRNFYFPKGFVNDKGHMEEPFIPVEFSVAAYRYGHGQVRQIYRIRNGFDLPLFRGPTKGKKTIPGFGAIPPRLVIDWRYFFALDRKLPRGFNFASKITPFLPDFLHKLGDVGVTGRDVPSLAARNLNRGRIFRLPSGQSVAKTVLPVLEKRGILSYWQVLDSRPDGWQGWLLPSDQSTKASLGDVDTPLWYYVLQESAYTNFAVPKDQRVAAAPRAGNKEAVEFAPGIPTRFTLHRTVAFQNKVIQEKAAPKAKAPEAAAPRPVQRTQTAPKESRFNDDANCIINPDLCAAAARPTLNNQPKKTQAPGPKKTTKPAPIRPLQQGDYLQRAGGGTLGPVGGTIVGETLLGLLEHYREKTGKGLDYSPVIKAQPTKNNVLPINARPVVNLKAPLTATQERIYDPATGWRDGGVRYQMRNLIFDAGLGHPVSYAGKESATRALRR